MIVETASDALIFGLILFVFFLMAVAVIGRVIERFGEALRGWLG